MVSITSISAISRGPRLGFVGNSLGSRGNFVNATNFGENIIGFSTWVKLLTRHRCYSPYNYNVSVAGATTDTYLAQVASLLALGVDMIVIGGVRNDAAGAVAPLPDTTAGTITYNMKAAINLALNAGVIVIAFTEPPPAYASWAGATNEWIALQYNRWLRAQREAHKGLYVAELDPTVADLTATDHWKPKTSYVDAGDNVHPMTWGAYSFAVPIANIINTLYPDQYKTTRNVDDYFDATNNPYGNLLGSSSTQAGQMFAGTSGTKGGTASGNVGTGWVLTNASAGGAAAAGSKVSFADGAPAQQVDISGTATVTTGKVNLNTGSNTIAWASLVAGDIVEASVEASWGTTTNIAYVNAFLQVTMGGITTIYSAAPSSILTPAAGYGLPTETGGPVASLSVPLRTPPVTITATPTAMQLFLSMGFVSPLSGATVAGSFIFVGPQVNKVAPAS